MDFQRNLTGEPNPEEIELYPGEKADIEKILRAYRDELFGDSDGVSKEMYETAVAALNAGTLQAARSACFSLWKPTYTAAEMAATLAKIGH